MRDDEEVLDLTFPGVELGDKETPWNLSFLLYKGGSKAHAKRVGRLIASGELGAPVAGRSDLVIKIHEFIRGKVVGGGSVETAKSQIVGVRQMFAWADKADQPLDLGSVQKTFLAWTDSLVHRQQVIKEINQRSAYTVGASAGLVLDGALERKIPLISMTRLTMPKTRKTARGVAAEKQVLAETFEFGRMLQDICDALTVDTVLRGVLPLRIPLRNGAVIVEWSGYPNHGAIERHMTNAPPKSENWSKRHNHQKSLAHFARWTSDGTLRTRYPLSNRRCEAELLMFIGQTGMNLAQAHKLKLRHFYYASHIDGYQVRDRKGRRGGDVLFEICREYKPHFERYLGWRRELFPDADALFPLVQKGGRSFTRRPQFAMRKVCERLKIRFVPPQTLRNTRVNWLLRRSGDPNLTADMAQHTKETLLDVYERPSQQRAMVEVTHFWAKNDPTVQRAMAVAPGQCDGKPVPLKDLPRNATEPDCNRASGCMWCEHHRDIDSLDYLWSLACFRHLKIIEVSKWTPPLGTREVHPAEHSIERISLKLRWFSESNARRKEWVEEALARVEEGNYHSEWARRIGVMEGLA